MSNSMMRVTGELLEDVKLLKEVKAAKGKLGTHNKILHELVKTELRKTHAQTQDGYLAEGVVVLGPAGKPVVIRAVRKNEVVFNDDTYIINGSVACVNLKLLANSIEEFEGGAVNV